MSPNRFIPVAVCSLLALAGCDNEFKLGDNADVISYNFQQGAQNWTAGFSDYPTNDAAIYELDSGIRNLPAGFQGSGYMLSGHNRSDDLFMFLKRKISGLSPSSKYKAQLKVTFSWALYLLDGDKPLIFRFKNIKRSSLRLWPLSM